MVGGLKRCGYQSESVRLEGTRAITRRYVRNSIGWISFFRWLQMWCSHRKWRVSCRMRTRVRCGVGCGRW